VVSPNVVSAPGQPYIFDKIMDEVFPQAITEQLKETVKKVVGGPWKGNPDSSNLRSVEQ